MTGIGARDHHTEAHQAAHNSGGGDALKLDDLAAPDDDTDLDGGPSQATQVALEVETDENTYAPPDLIKHSPGVVKAYCQVSSAGTLQANSYNVTSSAKDTTGDYTVTWATDFSNDDYGLAATVIAGADGSATITDFQGGETTAGAVGIETFNQAGSNSDLNFTVVAHGDQ